MPGHADPRSATTPSANAMSVAIGIPHPSRPSPPALNAKKIAAGTIIPPSAAIAGSATALRIAQLTDDELALDLHPDDEEEQPHQQVVDEVREILLEHVAADLDAHRPSPERLVAGLPGELAQTSATTVAATSRIPPAASTWRKRPSGWADARQAAVAVQEAG